MEETLNQIVYKNDLENYFYNNTGRKLHKWIHYFEIYDRFFSKFRNKPCKILEIGVQGGGSLDMWKDYFGEQVKIYGIDVDPRCANLSKEGIEIFIGDQSDRNFLKSVKDQIGDIDILIDDGGHIMNQQIVSFEELYPIIKNDGIYLCEDLHTSYWDSFGGGLHRQDTFIEYSKFLIDKLNAWHIPNYQQDDFSRTAYSMCFFDSVLVIEKREITQPWHKITGYTEGL